MSGVWDPIGTLLEDVAREWTVGCLLEDPHGRIVCHALGEQVPEAAVRAVISRCSVPLHEAARRLRTTGALTGGPLLSGALNGWTGTVTVAPLAGAGHLWLFGDPELGTIPIERIARDLSSVLHRIAGQATVSGLYECLHGQGPDVAALDRWVAVLRQPEGQGWAPLAVHRFLSTALAGCSGHEVTVTHTEAFVVLRDADGASAARWVSEAMRGLAAALELTVVGAVAPATSGLNHAREVAERSLSSLAIPGRCTTVDEARSHQTLHGVLDLVRTNPPLWRDPLQDLLAAGEPVVRALRAWLDAHGDVPAAADLLGLHTNTLRYRIKRATALVPADLEDPVARLEIHLRLLALDTRRPPG